jgi:hypothetical protein
MRAGSTDVSAMGAAFAGYDGQSQRAGWSDHYRFVIVMMIEQESHGFVGAHIEVQRGEYPRCRIDDPGAVFELGLFVAVEIHQARFAVAQLDQLKAVTLQRKPFFDGLP